MGDVRNGLPVQVVDDAATSLHGRALRVDSDGAFVHVHDHQTLNLHGEQLTGGQIIRPSMCMWKNPLVFRSPQTLNLHEEKSTGIQKSETE